MIYNIVDRRKRKYRWQEINAIIEHTSNDNSCEDSDQCEYEDGGVMYEERANIHLHDAILWAGNESTKVTLYLYDKGEGFS